MVTKSEYLGGGYCDSAYDGEEVSTGTTIVAVSCEGGVVLGADSRTSAGSFIVNRAARKISKLHDRIYVCRSGSAADTQAVTTIVKKHLSEHSQELGHTENPRVGTAARLFQMICYDYKHMLTAGLIVAGYDDRWGGQIFSIPIGGTKLRVPFAAGGSGSPFIAGYMDANYKEGMGIAECELFVKRCVAHAIARDGSSGGMIRTVTITKDDVREDCILGNNLPFKL